MFRRMREKAASGRETRGRRPMHKVYPLREAIANGERLGPKIVASGAIVDGPNSFSNPAFTVSVVSAEEAREAVRAHKKEGADFIKVYDGLPHDAYFAIADEVKK